jgi:hypothetical protein
VGQLSDSPRKITARTVANRGVDAVMGVALATPRWLIERKLK